MSIFVTQSSMPNYDDYSHLIKKIWENRHLTNRGPLHLELEKKLKDYLKVSNISIFVNGHLALEEALESLDLEGEVITTPYTFVSTTHSIVRAGLTPVFCDVEEYSFTIDPKKIEELITDKTCAIMPVHVYGNICDNEEIEKIAEKHNLKVIYDAAHAFGVKYKGRGIGSYGDYSMFSFHATKVFNTIEGGCLTFNDNSKEEKLNILKNFGITGEESIDYIGTNAKLDEFRAAMGLLNIENIDKELEKRKQVFEKYVAELKAIKGLRLIEYRKGVEPNYAYFPIIVNTYKFGASRDDIYDALKENNIYSRKYFFPATNNIKAYEGKFDRGNTPISDKLSKTVLCLPMYADLSIDEITKICEIIKTVQK